MKVEKSIVVLNLCEFFLLLLLFFGFSISYPLKTWKWFSAYAHIHHYWTPSICKRTCEYFVLCILYLFLAEGFFCSFGLFRSVFRCLFLKEKFIILSLELMLSNLLRITSRHPIYHKRIYCSGSFLSRCSI